MLAHVQIVEDAASVPAANETSASPAQPASRLSFFIDGAHTPESMASCGQWFAEAATSADQAPPQPQSNGHAPAQDTGGSHAPELQRILLFHCMKVSPHAAETLVLSWKQGSSIRGGVAAAGHAGWNGFDGLQQQCL